MVIGHPTDPTDEQLLAAAESALAIPEAERIRYSEALYTSVPDLDWLEQKRGIGAAAVADFHLGIDGDRLTIPIRDHRGWIQNIKSYHPDGMPKMLGRRGRRQRLFPKRALRERLDQPIVACEGELDAILGWQEGLRTLTSGGAGTLGPWQRNLARVAGQDVWIVFDNDDAGRNGARNLYRLLLPVAASVTVYQVPLPHQGADLTDYLMWKKGAQRAA